MKKLLLGIVAITSFFAASAPAYAHYFASDNSMSVLLHIDPEDEATPAGRSATLNFIFNDSSNRFKLTDCTCQLTISEQGKQLLNTQLSPEGGQYPSVYGSMVPFIFPNKATYQVALAGTPLQSSDFQPFKLSWNVPITASPPPPPAVKLDSNFFKYFAAILIILVVIGAAVFILT